MINQTAQVISEPQHIGDLILPQPFGQRVTETTLPSAVVMVSGTNSQLQDAHFMPTTPIPHELHEY